MSLAWLHDLQLAFRLVVSWRVPPMGRAIHVHPIEALRAE